MCIRRFTIKDGSQYLGYHVRTFQCRYSLHPSRSVSDTFFLERRVFCLFLCDVVFIWGWHRKFERRVCVWIDWKHHYWTFMVYVWQTNLYSISMFMGIIYYPRYAIRCLTCGHKCWKRICNMMYGYQIDFL